MVYQCDKLCKLVVVKLRCWVSLASGRRPFASGRRPPTDQQQFLPEMVATTVHHCLGDDGGDPFLRLHSLRHDLLLHLLLVLGVVADVVDSLQLDTAQLA